jgi:hypothetical protein
MILGCIFGLIFGNKAFLHVTPLLTPHSQMYGKDSYNFLGPHHYRIVLLVCFFAPSFIFFTTPSSHAFLIGEQMVEGSIISTVFTYFLILAVKTFQKEKLLTKKIIIAVD